MRLGGRRQGELTVALSCPVWILPLSPNRDRHTISIFPTCTLLTCRTFHSVWNTSKKSGRTSGGENKPRISQRQHLQMLVPPYNGRSLFVDTTLTVFFELVTFAKLTFIFRLLHTPLQRLTMPVVCKGPRGVSLYRC